MARAPLKKDRFFIEVVKVVGLGSAFASIPLFASMENLQPPWPTAIAYISAAVVLIGALIVREYGEGAQQRMRRRLLLSAGAITLVGLFSYLYLYSLLVLPVDDERIILGFRCNAEAQRIYSACPHLTENELADAGYDPKRLYTPASFHAARLALAAAWMLFTAGLVAAAGWAIVGRRDETPDLPKPPLP